MAGLAERQTKELHEAPEAERSQVADRHQAQWTEAQKILEVVRAGLETLRTADDAGLREARGRVNEAATGSAADLAARLKEDAQNTQPLRADLDRDAEQLRDRLVKSFELPLNGAPPGGEGRRRRSGGGGPARGGAGRRARTSGGAR